MNSRIAILLFFVLFSCSCDKLNKTVKNKNYKGVISKKYKELMNHDMWEFEVNSNNMIFKIGPQYFPRSWEYGEVGDSIIKKKDSMYIRIIKKNNESQIFYYKD